MRRADAAAAGQSLQAARRELAAAVEHLRQAAIHARRAGNDQQAAEYQVTVARLLGSMEVAQ